MNKQLQQLLNSAYLANTLTKESNAILSKAYIDYMSYRTRLDNNSQTELEALHELLEALHELHKIRDIITDTCLTSTLHSTKERTAELILKVLNTFKKYDYLVNRDGD